MVTLAFGIGAARMVEPPRVVHSGDSDEALMLAYVDGDARAFRMLFERYGPRLHGMIVRRIGSPDEARDLVQQTFLKLHAARADFRRDALFRPWVVTIAMNLVRERGRTRARRPTTNLDDVDVAGDARTSEPYERRMERERVQRALASLPDAQREVVELHWLDELPFAEVATIVGASEGAVRVRAHRAYARLETLLREEQP